MDHINGNEIVIPSYATAVLREEYTFRRDITGVVLHDDVTYIGDRAFAMCGRLAGIELPDSVEYMGSGAFERCVSLRCMRIPASLKEIPAYAFAGCVSLERLEIPGSVTRIGECAFMGCAALSEVVIPESVKEMAWSAFAHCGDIRLVYDHEITMTGDWFPAGGAAEAMLEIPDSVRVVGERACAGNTFIRKAVVPASVTRIKKEAFRGCTGLEQVIVRNPECSIDSTAFNDCPLLGDIIFEDGNSVQTVDAAAVGCVIKDGVLQRYEGTASELKLPDGVIGIAEQAFRGCTALERLHIPMSVKELGGMMFHKAARSVCITYEGTAADWEKLMPHKAKWINEFADDGYHHGHGKHWRHLQRIPVLHTGDALFECTVHCLGDGCTLTYGEAELPPPEHCSFYDDGWK